MGYSREFLLSVRDGLPDLPLLPQSVVADLRRHDLHILPHTARGTRAGKHHQRPIPTFYSVRNDCDVFLPTTGVNQNNLIDISADNACCQIPVLTQCHSACDPDPPNKIRTRHLVQIKCDNLINPLNNTSMSFGLLNARSVKNKVSEIVDYIVDGKLDIVAITETWLGSAGHDQITEGDLCPPGYKLLLSSRSHGRGGGVALLIKSSIRHKMVHSSDRPASFEYLEVVCKTKGPSMNLIVIYRPPPNQKNKLTVKQFMSEFTTFLEERIVSSEKLCIVGDFNFHVDDGSNHDALLFTNLLESLGLDQHVDEETHQKGHTLDLVISRKTDELIENVKVHDMTVSDHYWVHCSLRGPKPSTVRKEISFRKLKSICVEQFETDILASSLSHIDPQDSIENAVNIYNEGLSHLLDQHAPVTTKVVTLHPNSPWYTPDVDVAKKDRRKAEQVWRKSKLTVHREIFIEKRKKVNSLIQHAKEDFYSGKISEAPDQKSLFNIVNTLLHRKPQPTLPDHESPEELANRFGEFFSQKITNIRQRLDSATSATAILPVQKEETAPPLISLAPTTPEEVKKIVMDSKTTSCSLDPIPTSFLKVLLHVILPILTQIVNMSFDQCLMPPDLKQALIIPLLKKTGLDPEILKHFRPVSNLPYLSKLIERVSAKRLLDHISINNLHEKFQSAYKQFHSTETALLRVHSDILTALDNKKCVLLVLLDLSAAFDTIDHHVLLSRLKSVTGLSGKAYKWFASYLSDRRQSVLIDKYKSTFWELIFGVPQGSVLGPLLFVIYMSPLGDILRSLGIQYHLYADDTQIYLTFDIDGASGAVQKMEEAISVIKTWMTQNFLCLNDDKTEVLVMASRTSLPKLSIPTISIGDACISVATNARNIGFFFDQTMNLEKQINLTCQSAWFHLRNIAKIRQYLDLASTECLVHAFITSKLDFNNSLLQGLPDILLNKLQIIQNAAARIVTGASKRDHITPILKNLHWLPVKQRIKYKVLLFVYKALQGLAPTYISEMITLRENSSRSSRLNGQKLLLVPRSRTVTYGDRNFRTAGPQLWNELPSSIKCCESIDEFKGLLKTHLFKDAFC
jgi:exonuclease III